MFEICLQFGKVCENNVKKKTRAIDRAFGLEYLGHV